MWMLRRLAASAWVEVVVWSVWLVVVVGSLVLPLYLGISYLLARDCFPNLVLTLPPGALSGFAKIPGEEIQGWLLFAVYNKATI